MNQNSKISFSFGKSASLLAIGLLSFFCLLACVSAQQATIESAEEELKGGKYSAAIASFNSLLQAAPKDERTQAGLLKAYLETGKYTEAEVEAKKFLARGESSAARLALAEVMAITGRYALAITEFEKVSQIAQKAIEKAEKEEQEKKADAEEKPAPVPSPKAQKVTADLRRAELLHLTGKEEAAKEIFAKLVEYYEENDVDSAEELTVIARTLIYLEKYQDSKDIYLEAIAADDTYIEAQLGGGELFTSKYNYEEAATFFVDAAKINPNSARLHLAIAACRKAGKYVGICGQGPSDHPDLAAWLVEEGIESLSLNPDTVVETWLYLAKHGKTA